MSKKNKKINNEVPETASTPTKKQLNKLHEMGVNIHNVSIKKITFLDAIAQDCFINGTDLAIPVQNLKNNKNINYESN